MVEAWPQTENGVLMRAAGAMSLGSGSVLPLFSFGQSKGQARILSLLLLLGILFEDAPEVNVAEAGGGTIAVAYWPSPKACVGL